MKKIITSIFAIALMATMCVTAFAASPTVSATDTTTKPAITDSKEKCERPALTAEQKAEMEANKAKMEASQKKWAALTDAQKEEIYALKDKAADIEIQIIDKYLKDGIIDEAMSTEMKAKLAENKTNMRENDKMPMFGGKFGLSMGEGKCGPGGIGEGRGEPCMGEGKGSPSCDDTAPTITQS